MAAGASGPIAIAHLTTSIRRDGDRVKTAEAFEVVKNASNANWEQINSLQTQINNISGLTIAQLVAAGFRRSWTSQTQLVAGANSITFADPDNEGDSLTIWVRQVASGTVGTVTFGSNILFCDPYYVTSTFDLVTIYETRAMPDPDDSDTLKWFGVAPANAEQTL